MFQTDFLFATPSFIGGMASVLDIGSTLIVYNQSCSPEFADARALRSDWSVVGKDIQESIQRFGESHDGED